MKQLMKTLLWYSSSEISEILWKYKWNLVIKNAPKTKEWNR